MSEKVESKKYTIPKIREIIYAFKNQCLTSSHPSFGIFKDLLILNIKKIKLKTLYIKLKCVKPEEITK